MTRDSDQTFDIVLTRDDFRRTIEPMHSCGHTVAYTLDDRTVEADFVSAVEAMTCSVCTEMDQYAGTA